MVDIFTAHTFYTKNQEIRYEEGNSDNLIQNCYLAVIAEGMESRR